MKKFGTRLLTAVVASSMIVTPVFAAPSVDDLKENKAAKLKIAIITIMMNPLKKFLK